MYSNKNNKLRESVNFKIEPIENWSKLISLFEKKHINTFEENGKQKEWIFRGVVNSSHHLSTTLERDLGNIGIDFKKLPDRYSNDYTDKYNVELINLLKNGFKGQSIYEIESGLIRRFQRQCHHYEIRVPQRNKIVEWLALMRHHGAPSRLLDWTYSFYVALFFALKDAEKICAVWALEKYSLKENRDSKIPAEVWKDLSKDKDVEKYTTWEKYLLGALFLLFIR